MGALMIRTAINSNEMKRYANLATLQFLFSVGIGIMVISIPITVIQIMGWVGPAEVFEYIRRLLLVLGIVPLYISAILYEGGVNVEYQRWKHER